MEQIAINAQELHKQELRERKAIRNANYYKNNKIVYETYYLLHKTRLNEQRTLNYQKTRLANKLQKLQEQETLGTLGKEINSC